MLATSSVPPVPTSTTQQQFPLVIITDTHAHAHAEIYWTVCDSETKEKTIREMKRAMEIESIRRGTWRRRSRNRGSIHVSKWKQGIALLSTFLLPLQFTHLINHMSLCMYVYVYVYVYLCMYYVYMYVLLHHKSCELLCVCLCMCLCV